MAIRDWLKPPRRLIALFLLVTLVPSLALVASGWRLLEQDRALSLSQFAERREQAADLAVSDLERLISLENRRSATHSHSVPSPTAMTMSWE